MNRKFGQFPVNSFDQPQAAPPASAPRAFPHVLPSDSVDQALLRPNLRRSVRMHPRLVIGFALVGLVLASAYLFRYRSVYTAQSLVYIQPTPTEVREGAPVHWTEKLRPRHL